MSTQTGDFSARTRTDEPVVTRRDGYARRTSTETKSFIKTSEFWVFVVATAAVLIATYAKDDSLTAWRGWLLATLLAISYIVTRGLAKAGSREPYTERQDY